MKPHNSLINAWKLVEILGIVSIVSVQSLDIGKLQNQLLKIVETTKNLDLLWFSAKCAEQLPLKAW